MSADLRAFSVAEVIVDIFAEETDRPFDYLVPPSLRGRVRPGCRVMVPFGPRQIKGLVVNLKTSTTVPPERLKALDCPLDDEPLLDAHLLELSRWLAGYYLCTWSEALRAVLPQGAWTSGKTDVGAKLAWRVYLTDAARALGPDGLVALAESLSARAPAQARSLKYLVRLLGERPDAENGVELAALVSAASAGRSAVENLAAKGIVALRREPSRLRPSILASAVEAACHEQTGEAPAYSLTDEQTSALERIRQSLDRLDFSGPAPTPVLLFGVTGSGKTEVYIRAIAEALSRGMGAIALVPEIALTPQTVARFASRFGNKVALLHSALSPVERRDEWLRIKNGEALVVVGTRSAVFSPVQNLGLIILDEEHEHTYKQEEDPKYRAHEVAAWRAKKLGAVLVLGSATPSVETFWRAETGRVQLCSLQGRVAGRPLPPVEVVDMRHGRSKRARSLFSDVLEEALRQALSRNEQVLLLLNRRGYARFLLCQECGHVVGCPNCAVSLTYHAALGRLTCHYCGYGSFPPESCPACGSPHIRQFGSGTERVERELALLFPGTTVARLDLDSARRKGTVERVLAAFARGEVQILVGTQMIAKGLDLPHVTTVGVVDADTALYLPDIRAAERTFQLLTQVAGRAGRGDLPGRVIIQTFNPEHYAVKAAAGHDFLSFYREEIRVRQTLGYPPFAEMIGCQVVGPAPNEVMEAANRLASLWRARGGPGFRIFGPTPAPVVKVGGNYRFNVVSRGPNLRVMRESLRAALDEARTGAPRSIRFSANVQPLSML